MIQPTPRGFFLKNTQNVTDTSKDINLLNVNNYKEHFFLKDGLNNISYDLDFSIYKKYRCFAGCEICYLKNDWIGKEEFNQVAVTPPPTQKHVDKLLEIFDFFELVSIIDDLYYLNSTHPELFAFYQEHQKRFYLSSMTDNSILRHRNLIEGGFHPRAIHEISISDSYLQKVGVKSILKNLESIHKHVTIKKIKHLLFLKCVSNENSKILIAWCESTGINIEKQLEFSDQVSQNVEQFKSKDLKLNDAKYEESTTYTEEFGAIYPLNNEILFLMNNSFYSELKSATTKDRNEAFLHVDRFQAVKFLSDVLKEKKRIYQLYERKIRNQGSVAYKYFEYIAKNMSINENFNFVPNLILKPYTQYYKKIVANNLMIETPYGLVSPDFNTQKGVVPIVTFNES